MVYYQLSSGWNAAVFDGQTGWFSFVDFFGVLFPFESAFTLIAHCSTHFALIQLLVVMLPLFVFRSSISCYGLLWSLSVCCSLFQYSTVSSCLALLNKLCSSDQQRTCILPHRTLDHIQCLSLWMAVGHGGAVGGVDGIRADVAQVAAELRNGVGIMYDVFLMSGCMYVRREACLSSHGLSFYCLARCFPDFPGSSAPPLSLCRFVPFQSPRELRWDGRRRMVDSQLWF